MNSCELATLISAVASSISQNKTSEEIALIASILVQLGDTLATISILKSKEEEQ